MSARKLLAGLTIAAPIVVASAARQAVIDADALPVLSIEQVQRTGSVDDPKAGFNAILALDVDREGQMYVYESKDMQIRVLARDGRLVRTIGRGGKGPGEFTRVTAMGVVGDTVWTYDSGERQVALFRRNGALISDRTVGVTYVALPDSSFGSVAPLALRDDGRFISQVEFTLDRDRVRRMPAGTLPAPRASASDTAMAPRLRISPSGSVVDTAGWEPIPPPDGRTSTVPRIIAPEARLKAGLDVIVDGVRYTVPTPPTDSYLRSTLIDGSALVVRPRATVAGSSEFTVTRFNLSGKSLHRLRFRYQPGRYAGAVLDTLAMRPVLSRGQPSDAAFKAVRAALVYPPFASPIYATWSANDGSLWLQREDNAGPRFRWIVVEKSGAVRGVVAIPRSSRPLWARADTLIAVDTDDVGVPWVVRYHIKRR